MVWYGVVLPSALIQELRSQLNSGRRRCDRSGKKAINTTVTSFGIRRATSEQQTQRGLTGGSELELLNLHCPRRRRRTSVLAT
jgi:hypothetical protein